MTETAKPFDVQSAIVSMLAVKFLQLQEGGEYTFTQDDIKAMLEQWTVRLELLKPNAPQVSDIRCSIVTLKEAQQLAQQMKKVHDRTKKKS